MAGTTNTRGGDRANRFGGDWTDRKLEVLARYLRAYTTALGRQDFTKGYIDAFAGTGYRHARNDNDSAADQDLLFPDLAVFETQGLLDGSARVALQSTPHFDKYVFVESDPTRCKHLEELGTEFPDLAGRIAVRNGEANAEIQKLCSKDWRKHRAVLFLDPFGMQVEWRTIQAIASTRAIDLWLLFPLGIGVNRLLTRTGEIPPAWRKRLDLLLGTTDWYDEFYSFEPEPTLFDPSNERVVKATTATIGRYFNDRLRSAFPGVANEPGVLRNSSNNPLYLLCFAVGNESAKNIALKIAEHVLKELR